MKAANSFILVKEGFAPVALVGLIISFFLFLSDSLLWQLLLLAFFVAFSAMFRNTERQLTYFDEGSIVSVCDAVVHNIETIECTGKITGECLKITLHNGVLDSGVLRTPFKSSVALNELQMGAHLGINSSKALKLNEQAKVMFVGNHEDHKMILKHYVSGMNTGISLYPSVEDKLEADEPYGFMLRGTIFMFLPINTRLDIKKGDELKAGESLIGYFSH